MSNCLFDAEQYWQHPQEFTRNLHYTSKYDYNMAKPVYYIMNTVGTLSP